MGMFRNTLLLAQQGNEKAMEKLLNRYDPLLKKCSIIQGHFDEDLYQSLILEFVRAVCGEKCRWVRAQKGRNVKGVVRSDDSLPLLWQTLYS